MRLPGSLIIPALLFASTAQGSDDSFEERVREYILKNPEVIVEALNRMAAREAATAQAQKIAAYPELFDDPPRHGFGKPGAPIRVIEFFDYRCAPCKAIHPKLVQLVDANPELWIEMRQLPILSPGSERAARFALAVQAVFGVEAYLRVHEQLFAHRGVFNSAAFEAIAAAENLDFARIDSAMYSAEITARIAYNRDTAVGLGIVGTPAFVTQSSVSVGESDTAELAKLWLNQ